MSGVQKTIKYLAIAFAFLLIFWIVSSIIYGVSFLGGVFTNNDSNVLEDMKKLIENDEDIKFLDVDIKSSNIIVKVGNTFKAETTNKYIECKQNNDKIVITEKSHNWFKSNDGSELIIYVPEDMVLDSVKIDNAAGKIEIEKLSTKILRLDLGAGKVDINNLSVLNDTKIDGGAGEVIINNSSLNNLDLDMGVGKFTLDAKILGNSKIDHGVGEAIINLLGSKEDYQINIDKGLGSVRIDGKNVGDNETIGNGINKIDIDCGVGSITVNFKGI